MSNLMLPYNYIATILTLLRTCNTRVNYQLYKAIYKYNSKNSGLLSRMRHKVVKSRNYKGTLSGPAVLSGLRSHAVKRRS